MAKTAPEGQEFVLHDGTKLRSTRELYKALAKMPDDIFHQFVNAEKNDFARWIELSLNDKFLAAKVRRCQTQKELRKKLFMNLSM